MSNNRTQNEIRRFPAEEQGVAEAPGVAVDGAGITQPAGLPEPYRLSHNRPFISMSLDDGKYGVMWLPRKPFEAALNRWMKHVAEKGGGAEVSLHPDVMIALREYVGCWLNLEADSPQAMIVDRQWGHA